MSIFVSFTYLLYVGKLKSTDYVIYNINIIKTAGLN